MSDTRSLQEIAEERESVALANRNELVRLMGEFGLFIPAADFANWRPTARERGDVNAVAYGLEIIATNGLLAYFLTTNGEIFCGHIQCFSGEVKPLFSTQNEKHVSIKKERKPRKTILQKAIEMLQQPRSG